MAPTSRFGLGWDVAGIVDAVGPDVTRWRIGDRVIGLRDLLRLTELGAADVLTDANDLGSTVRDIVPGGVDTVADAAVLGVGAHDALRGKGTFVALVAALVDAAHLTPRIATTVALTEARRGHEPAEQRGLRGKVALRPCARAETLTLDAGRRRTGRPARAPPPSPG